MASVFRQLFQKSYPNRNFRTVFRSRSGPTQIVPQLWRPNYHLIRDNGEEIMEIRRAFANVKMDVTRYRRMYLREKNYEGNPLIEFPKVERRQGYNIITEIIEEDDDEPEEIGQAPEQVEPQLQHHPADNPEEEQEVPIPVMEEGHGGLRIEEIIEKDDDDEIGEEPEQVEPQLEHHPAAELEEQEGPIPLMEESDDQERELDNPEEVDEDFEG